MILYGASGHAKVIIDILIDNNINIDGLIDDNNQIEELLDYPVYHCLTKFNSVKNKSYIVSIGNNRIRKEIVAKLGDVKFATVVHSSVILSPFVSLGVGVVVMHGSIINSSSKIGNHVIINSRAVVEHDCLVGDYVHISPGAILCGNVKLEEGVWVGAGATIKQGVTIGKWSVIGAGAVVISDVPSNVVVAGVPSKLIKVHDV